MVTYVIPVKVQKSAFGSSFLSLILSIIQQFKPERKSLYKSGNTDTTLNAHILLHFNMTFVLGALLGVIKKLYTILHCRLDHIREFVRHKSDVGYVVCVIPSQSSRIIMYQILLTQ